MKNLKIGYKILLGYAVVIALMITSTIMATVSSLTSIGNLDKIDADTTLQALGNDFIQTFYLGRLNVRIITIEVNENAYNEALKKFSDCEGLIRDMYSQIEQYPILEKFSLQLGNVSARMETYVNSVNDLQGSNNKLFAIQTEIEAMGEKLTELSDALDQKHVDVLNKSNTEVVAASEITRQLNNLLDGATISNCIWNIRKHSDNMFLEGNSFTEFDDEQRFIDNSITLLNTIQSDASEVAELLAILPVYREAVLSFRAEMQRNNDFITKIFANADDMLRDLDSLIDSINDAVSENVDNTTNTATGYLIAIIIVASVSVAAAVIIAFLVSGSITKPVRRLKTALNEVADGNLEVNADSDSRDEIGDLTRAMRRMIGVINLLISEMNRMSGDFDAGDIDCEIDVSLFSGSYTTVAKGVNKMAGGIVKEVLNFTTCLKELGAGNFDADIPLQPGKKVVLNESLNALRSNLKAVAGEINSLVEAAAEGRLDDRADVKKYSGDWVDILNGLNSLMEAIIAPIDEAANVLQQVSAGNFEHEITGNYRGKFLTIKNSVNDTVTNVASYINEISSVLKSLAQNNLDQAITREYVGKFSEIKDALNNIIDKFNSVISEILSAAEQVAAGARQMSESSMSLAQGSTEQASSVEELTATVISVNEKTQANAENAKRSSDLSNELKSHALEGNNQMKNMLESMKAISEASNNISKIITLIKDISFQTNLLALNASIEAAHAGVHGDGFSVVADEVRNLAVKSQEAANNTTELIEMSIQRVNEGTSIAEMTDEALEKIVSGVSGVSTLVAGIAGASEDQAIAISQINEGVGQIANVVQANSATSEEAASASQELSSQAEVLRNLVSGFTMKKQLFN